MAIKCIDCKHGSFPVEGIGPYKSRKPKYVGYCCRNKKATTQNCFCEYFNDRDWLRPGEESMK